MTCWVHGCTEVRAGDSHKHTKGPWHVVHTGTRTEVMAQGLLHPIAHVHRGGRSAGVGYRLPAEANAAFIVRACNSHDELLEALEQLANEASGFRSMADPQTHGNTNMAVLKVRIDEARAAIAKAKGEV